MGCLFLAGLWTLMAVCLGLVPIKIEKIGNIRKYGYQNFVYMDDRPQQQFQSFISTPSTRILTNFFNNLPKTQKSLQILSLPDRGLYQLILLTQANNFGNQIIIVKEDPEEYGWVRKNLYLNGLEQEPNLFFVGLGERNLVAEGLGKAIEKFFKLETCTSCEKLYRMQTNISQLIRFHEEEGNGKPKAKSVHLLMEIPRLQLAKQVRKEIELLHGTGRGIEVVFELKKEMPSFILIPRVTGFKLFNLGLKIDSKTASIQFKQLSGEQSTAPNAQKFDFLPQGIYYLTNTESFFKKPS